MPKIITTTHAEFDEAKARNLAKTTGVTHEYFIRYPDGKELRKSYATYVTLSVQELLDLLPTDDPRHKSLGAFNPRKQVSISTEEYNSYKPTEGTVLYRPTVEPEVDETDEDL